jgi:hypothetical protein
VEHIRSQKGRSALDSNAHTVNTIEYKLRLTALIVGLYYDVLANLAQMLRYWIQFTHNL